MGCDIGFIALAALELRGSAFDLSIAINVRELTQNGDADQHADRFLAAPENMLFKVVQFPGAKVSNSGRRNGPCSNAASRIAQPELFRGFLDRRHYWSARAKGAWPIGHKNTGWVGFPVWHRTLVSEIVLWGFIRQYVVPQLSRLDTAQSCTRCYGTRHSSGIRKRVRTRRERGVAQGARPVAGSFTRSRRKQQALFEALSAKDFPLSLGPFLKLLMQAARKPSPSLLRRKRIVC